MLSKREDFNMRERVRYRRAAHVKNGKVNPIEIIQKHLHSTQTKFR